MSIQESIRIEDKGQYAVVHLDLIGEKVNKLSSPVMARLKEVVEELSKSSYKAVIIISDKARNFIAGADIEEIKKLSTKEQFLDVLKPAHEIFNALEDLPMPTIAAIHGSCMGGGTELVMCCDYRLATDAKETTIGLPETKLGILPGFGGCVRMPRIVGLQAALDIILAGKAVPGKKALRIGLIDECVPKEMLMAKAEQFAVECADGKKKKRMKTFRAKGFVNSMLEGPIGRPIVFSQARKALLKMTKGFYPAQEKAIDIIQQTYGMSNRQKALEIEMKGFAEVAITDVSKHLINLFFMMEGVKKLTGVSDTSVKPRDVKHMAVLGAGTMGGGIAQVGADKGVDVRMKDINNEALAIGFKQAAEVWGKKLKRRRMDKYQYEEKMAKITGTTDYSGFGQMDLVVEAIVENMEIKKKVIAETVKHCKNDCIIATNTSSLSVNEMAEAHPKPENFAGMHFFNPVNKMPLVEVIRGVKTSDETTATVFGLAKTMGKIPVVVKDGPGFLVNRLLMPWMIEGMHFLNEGMDIKTVDRYYTHKFGMPMGPFRLMDEVGLDVCVKVVKIFKDALGERIEVPPVAEKLAESDRLGKKNGKGFYLYDERGKETGVDSSVYAEMGVGQPTNPLSEKVCLERGVFAMINEAALALIEDQIVETPGEVDLAMIMGTGFPPFRGGLLRYADSLGTEYIVSELEMYASQYGARFKPSTPLANLAKNGKTFYREGRADAKGSSPSPAKGSEAQL
ncbi:MAG: enoyl-CoA hydratase/isomerase family protein [Bdellovibrionales bacterium]|nr:enoyl-CoA hydratase/isomerase family protein [Bdellovibrionales bacterium]